MKTERADQKSLEKIMDAARGDTRIFASAVHSHYFDMDRANRTSREMMYLHIGMLLGAIIRILPKDGNSNEDRRLD